MEVVCPSTLDSQIFQVAASRKQLWAVSWAGANLLRDCIQNQFWGLGSETPKLDDEDGWCQGPS